MAPSQPVTKRRFENKVVFITGASSGIGEALARQFASEGARVVLAARREERLQRLKQELGDQALIARCDVCAEDALVESVRSAVETFGRIDVVIANAGFGVAGKLKDLNTDDYRRQFETNVLGVVRTIQATLPEIEKSRGVIAITGSVAGHIALPGATAYSMSKFAVRALAEGLHYEVSRKGVAVVLLSPGFVRSEIRNINNQGTFVAEVPEGRPDWLVMPAEKAARQMADAIYSRKREAVITVHGKVAVFLRRFAPWLIDFMVSRGLRGRTRHSAKS